MNWKQEYDAYVKVLDVPKHNSYPYFCLGWDMENLGNVFEKCKIHFKELYGVVVDCEKFMKKFLISRCREAMETGNPRLLTEASIDIIEDYILEEYKGKPDYFVLKNKNKCQEYYIDQLYWVGSMYAYIHFRHDMLTRDIVKFIPLEEMLRMYTCGHEMDRTNVYERAVEVLPPVGTLLSKKEFTYT